MGTIEYLAQLDLEQLEFAKEEAERRINAIKEQSKVKLWVVSDGWMNRSCFSECDFQLAKAKLCEFIMSDEFKPRDVRSDHPVIYAQHVYESEVNDWMKLNT